MIATLVRTLVMLLGAVSVLAACPAHAQATSTASWSSAGASSGQAMPDPTTVTAGDGTTVRLDYASLTNGGSFVPTYGGSFVTYYSGQIGSATGVLLLAFDNDAFDPGDKVVVTLSLSRAATGLTFSLTDIDSGSFRDAVSVEYDTGSGFFQNAANTAAFYTTGKAVTRTSDGVVNGWTGTSGADTTSTNGNINFDFGNTAVQRIRITYFSYTGSGNPSAQIAGVSDLTFDNPGAIGGTRLAGTPPALACPAGSIVFDWDTVTWGVGSTSATYPFSSLGQIGFQLTNPGSWLNNSAFGGQSPRLQTVMDGGYAGQNLLLELVDLPNRSAQVSTTITLPTVMQGAQFRIADVDFGANQFADRVTVEGRYKGATVIPTLTNGITNYVLGNSAYGDGAAANGVADGNVVVTFATPIDQILVYYGNSSLAPADPGQQGVALHDFTFCRPITKLATTKVSKALSDPLNGTGNPKLIPGAIVEYCVLITNTGDTTATEVVGSDSLPANTNYVPGSMTSGTSCADATIVEDDDAVGADEGDPVGASFSNGTVKATAASLAAGATFALTFRVALN